MRRRLVVAGAAVALALGWQSASIRAQGNSPQSAQEYRYRAMDTNRDGVISRSEWRGSARSFNVHDWNGDGVLSGNEIRAAARQIPEAPDYSPNQYVLNDWSERQFRQLDANADNRISRQEWHYDVETFLRVDRNRDGFVSRTEFINNDIDDDRGDRFDDLDLNGNNRIEADEWHGGRQAFQWLDRNNDGVLSRTEVAGSDPGSDDQFSSLDMNRDRSISLSEWQWSRASFQQLDRNGDGRLTRSEFESASPLGPTGTSATVAVNSVDRWTDTGIYVHAGEVLTLTGSGTIQMSADAADVAAPQGARSGRRAPDAPLPQQPAGMLIARIGNSAPVVVGQSAEIRASRDGRLYLGVNDDHLPDNSGQFQVKVTVRR
jgi:Ca2+-binding EF-hand superfamily protein